MKAEGRSPIVQHQGNVPMQVQRLKPCVEIICMVQKAVSAAWRGARLAHTDEVWREAPSEVADVGDDVAPKIRCGRVSVQEYDRVPATNGDVTHLAVTDAYATTDMIVFGSNPIRHGISPLAIRGAPGDGGPERVAILEINSLQAIRFCTGKRTSRFQWVLTPYLAPQRPFHPLSRL